MTTSRGAPESRSTAAASCPTSLIVVTLGGAFPKSLRSAVGPTAKAATATSATTNSALARRAGDGRIVLGYSNRTSQVAAGFTLRHIRLRDLFAPTVAAQASSVPYPVAHRFFVGGHAIRVLIADDDPASREMVRTALQFDGYHVLEAADGLAAWELVAARRPALVLTDVQMPGIDGLELTALIKANGYHETKVIVFTGGMATKTQAQIAGADAYVTKSATVSELRAAVKRLCAP